MDCKRECYWNYDGICCSDELDNKYDEATGDGNCPLWLRPDFDKHFWGTYDSIKESIKHMNIGKLEQVKYAIDQINIECETKECLEHGGHSYNNCSFCKKIGCKYNTSEKYNELINNSKDKHKHEMKFSNR